MEVKIKAFVMWHKYSWQDEAHYTLSSLDWSKNAADYAVIKEMEFDIEIPDNFDPRPQQIAPLRKAKDELLVEAQKKVMNIDEQIQKLLALESK